MLRLIIGSYIVFSIISLSSPVYASAKELGEHLPIWSTIPFVTLLLAIAILPLVAEHWWESNRNRAIVSLGCGIPVAIYLVLQPHGGVAILHALHEYISFIVLLGALYIISGGLLLRGDIRATPGVNTLFLAVGAVLANAIGTTGASMLLIRPVLKTNSERKHTTHIPIFFIFVVSNMGGMLTPLGDPPLFLGYLRGVPFFWTMKLLPVWALSVGRTLVLFYTWDRLAYGRESSDNIMLDETQREPLRLRGLKNIVLLCGVIGGVFLPSPWREVVMGAMALASLPLTPKGLREENRFTYHPIIEVAVLFIGIFLAMVPALGILEARGASLGIGRPWQFFWATGLLSSFLDNAPTYVSFLSLAQGLPLAEEVVGVSEIMLMAISAGAVLMGANSYIGNGPNFMVKAIATEAGMKMPSFFGYMLWAAVLLWPLFAIVTMVFFRG